MDFHQKTLLSDEFGVGMAGLLVENFLNAGSFVDVSVALGDPAAYQDIELEGKTQPDYLMWGSEPNSPYYVVECKGTQTDRATSYDQLRRGLEQVPSVRFGAGQRQIVSVIVATCMLDDRTEVFVLDPPPDDDYPNKDSSETVSERTGKRSWRIRDPEAFHQRAVLAEESNLLKWAGQYQTAAVLDRRLERLQPEAMAMPNAPLETRRTRFGDFRGVDQPLFPALGAADLRLFTGVDEGLLEVLTADRPRAERAPRQFGLGRQEGQPADHMPAGMSVSQAGTCMIVEGL
jgi:hypothetical protein